MTSRRRAAVRAIGPWSVRWLLPLTLCALLVAHFGFQALAPSDFEYRALMEGYAAEGEKIIHGVDAVWTLDRLPGAAVAAAVLYGSRIATNARLQALSVALLALLLMTLEGLLEAPALFGLAPVLAALYVRWEFPQELMCFLVLIVAGFLIRYAREPNARNGLRLALAIGGAFLVRADLALLPPAVALMALVLWKPAGKRRPGRSVLIPLLVPYLFTLPALCVNFIARRRFIPFEAATGMFDDIAKAAVGMTHAGEPPLAAPFTSRLSPFAWALHEILGHPARYAAGYFARLHQAAAWCSPFLFFALWTLWARRRDRGIQALGLIVVYWIGLYCTVAIDERYFEPLQAPLILLASGLAGELVAWRPAASKRWSPVLLSAALAAVLAFDAYAAVQTLRGRRQTIEQASARHPNDWWLLEQAGKERLNRGEFSRAAGDFDRAAALLPVEDAQSSFARDLRLQRAAADLFAGSARRVWALPLDASVEHAETDFETRLLRADAWSRAGRGVQARAELEAAKPRWEVICEESACGSTDAVEGLARFIADMPSEPWPLAERARLEDVVARAYPRSAQARLAKAEVLARLAAASAPQKAADAGSDAEQARRGEAIERNAAADAAHAAEQNELRAARETDALIEQARAAFRRKDAEAARAALKRAVASRPRPEQLRRIAAAYSDIGDFRPALGVLAPLGETEDAIERARFHAALKQTDAARSELAKAAALGLDAAQEVRAALVYQDLKDYARALPLLENAATARPRDLSLRASLGVCEYLSGAPEKAVATLEAAIQADPRFLPPYLTLGYIDEQRADFRGAVALYERGLARSTGNEDDGTRRALIEALAAARRKAAPRRED